MALNDYDVGLAFARIEDELIASMMRNLKRHLDEEKEEGFDWSQWQVEQLKYLNEYRRRNKKKYGPQFKDINQKMVESIREAEKQGQKEEELRILQSIADDKKIRRRYANRQPSIEAQGDAFFRTNDKKLEALVEATQNDMQKAEQAVLRRSNDQYRQIIYDAQVYANTGAGTPQKAIDMATKDFLSRGIDSIVYKNGARHTISDYADMYIRTAERRATLMGEGKKRQEWGEQLVIVNKRGGHPCPKCAEWVGKILIDDVYSGGKPDGKHKLLSEAMAEGLYHPRCKDGHTTYIPGISKTPDPVTAKELKEAEKAEAKEAREQLAERQTEKYERLAEYSLDPDNKRIYEARAEVWKRQVGYYSDETMLRIFDKADELSEHEPISLRDFNNYFKQDILNTIENAPVIIRNLINKNSDRILIVHEYCAGIPCFTARGIRFNIVKDSENVLGKWATLFHEIGHNLDRIYGHLSASQVFIDALYSDFEKMVDNYIRLNAVSREEALHDISDALTGEPSIATLSDIIGGITNNECVGNFGHFGNYWNSKKTVASEAFADFFSAYTRNSYEELRNLREVFPNAFAIFENKLRWL